MIPDISKLVEIAITTHEMFEAYVQAGFTEDQAMTLIAKIISEHRTDEDNG